MSLAPVRLGIAWDRSGLTWRVAIGNSDILYGDVWNLRKASTGVQRNTTAVDGVNEVVAALVARRIDGKEAIVICQVRMKAQRMDVKGLRNCHRCVIYAVIL